MGKETIRWLNSDIKWKEIGVVMARIKKQYDKRSRLQCYRELDDDTLKDKTYIVGDEERKSKLAIFLKTRDAEMSKQFKDDMNNVCPKCHMVKCTTGICMNGCDDYWLDFQKGGLFEENNLDVELIGNSGLMPAAQVKKVLALPFDVNLHSVGDHDHCCLFYLCKALNPEELKFRESELKNARWLSREELSQVPLDSYLSKQALKAFDLIEK